MVICCCACRCVGRQNLWSRRHTNNFTLSGNKLRGSSSSSVVFSVELSRLGRVYRLKCTVLIVWCKLIVRSEKTENLIQSFTSCCTHPPASVTLLRSVQSSRLRCAACTVRCANPANSLRNPQQNILKRSEVFYFTACSVVNTVDACVWTTGGMILTGETNGASR